MEYYLTLTKDEVLQFITTRMDPERITVSKVRMKGIDIDYFFHIQYIKKNSKEITNAPK